MSSLGSMGESRKTRLPPTSSRIRFFPLADGGVLYLRGSRRVWTLNASSAFIWCALDACGNVEELAGSLAERFAIDFATALRDTLATLERYAWEGLLQEGAPEDDPAAEAPLALSIATRQMPPSIQGVVRCKFEISGQIVEICFQDIFIGRFFAELVAHLGVSAVNAVHTRLAVLADPRMTDRWDLFLDGICFAESVPQNEVLPHLLMIIFFKATEALHDRLLFHAAVLGRDGYVVLFPAESGSGKTTLSAGLVAKGWQYYSDEIAALDVDTNTVRPLPLPMSIKSGSVDALATFYPGLAERQSFLRQDGKAVRYLLPALSSLPDKESAAPVRALIFPRYHPAAENVLASIEKRDAFQRLAGTGSSSREFADRDVAAMIALVEQNPCYELNFVNLEQALALIENKL